VAGAVRPGHRADFAIVNTDLAHIPAQEICQASVSQTWIGGQAVYEHR
jgi:predicted amidohydrolase YtcJ